MTTTLLRGGRIHNPVEPHATCLAITDGVVSWIGPDTGIEQAGHIDDTVDLDGLFVAPAFVDAHVHCTDAGLAMVGLDLRSAPSLAAALDLLRIHASTGSGLIWGHGWDDAGWPERRPPTRSEIDAAVGTRPTYLTRIDVHSAVVSSALGDRLDRGRAGHTSDGPLTQDSHHEARRLARAMLSDADRSTAQRAFLDHVASRGIIEVHECAFADPQALADLAGLLALDTPVAVRAYLGQAVTDPVEAAELLARTGAHALGGDLSVDGALGSRTASLHAPYADPAHGAGSDRGVRYLTDGQIADHLVACARAGIQPGFHAIGDDAVAAVAGGLRRAAEILGGTLPLAAVVPRIEHAEMISAADIEILSRCGAVASVQPLFDALWGGDSGVYVQRLGAERARPMNPFAAIAAAGVTLAFGSDAPVTAAEPWAAVRAAVNHRTAGSSVTPRAAFTAHTRGAHRAARRMDRGVLTIGATADLAIWRTGELVRPEATEMARRWSTDPRSRVPLLPDLGPDAPAPDCVSTLSAGRIAYDTGVLVNSSLPR